MNPRVWGHEGISRHFRPGFMVALAFVVLGCAPDPDASTRVIEIRLAHSSPPGSLAATSSEEFVRRVNEELAGRVRVTLFGAGQLGSDEILMIKLKLGTVDIALPSTVVSSTIQSFGFFELPYLVADRSHLRLVEREIFWPHIAPAAAPYGFEVLALWEHGFRQITNNVRPIVTPGDLSGIKLRTPAGYWRVEAFRAFDANPTPMPLTEVFVALQTGVLDGQENPLPQIYASRFQEVQTYLSLSNHIYSPMFVMVGADRWATHPPDVRETMVRIAREVQEFSYEESERLDQTLRADLENAGMQINEIDRASFIAASRQVYDRFSTTVPDGQAWIDLALSLQEEPGDLMETFRAE